MQSISWLPLAALSAVFAALVAVFGKVGLEGVNTTVATTVRASVMFLLLLIVTLVSGKIGSITQINNRALLYIVLAGAAGALSWLFYFWALKLGKVSHIAAVDRLSVVFAAALALLFLGERIGIKDGVGLILITIGGILVALA